MRLYSEICGKSKQFIGQIQSEHYRECSRCYQNVKFNACGSFSEKHGYKACVNDVQITCDKPYVCIEYNSESKYKGVEVCFVNRKHPNGYRFASEFVRRNFIWFSAKSLENLAICDKCTDKLIEKGYLAPTLTNWLGPVVEEEPTEETLSSSGDSDKSEESDGYFDYSTTCKMNKWCKLHERWHSGNYFDYSTTCKMNKWCKLHETWH